MGFQKVEFEFPDEAKDDKLEVEKSSAVTIDLKNPQSHLEDKEVEVEQEEAKKPAEKEDDLDLEIVDDTPEEDRGRKPSDPPEDPSDDELESYSEKVRNRIKHFTKGYHDERRAKEAAERERQEAVALAQKLLEENKTLKQSSSKSQTALLAQAKQNAENAYKHAQNLYKTAYNDGDPDKVLQAQEKLVEARERVNKLANVKLPTLQNEESSVNTNNNTSEPVSTQQQQTQNTSVDERAANWAKENPWFQKDTEMTGYALGLHNKLVSEGMDPTSDEYYEAINSNVRRVFPDRFEDTEPKKQQKASNDNVVAPASRSQAPRKVRLTQSQVRLAKRLGLSNEQYAKQVALEMRNK